VQPVQQGNRNIGRKFFLNPAIGKQFIAREAPEAAERNRE
jgi:hypothetical protein